MRRQKQLIPFHRPEDGQYGDCWRTSIACVLDMDAADVPHFVDGYDSRETGLSLTDVERTAVREFLQPRGMVLLSWAVCAAGHMSDLPGLLSWWDQCNPGAPVLISVQSTAGPWLHSIVGCDGEVYCDPMTGTSMDASLYKPFDDPAAGPIWWIECFGARLPNE